MDTLEQKLQKFDREQAALIVAEFTDRRGRTTEQILRETSDKTHCAYMQLLNETGAFQLTQLNGKPTS